MPGALITWTTSRASAVSGMHGDSPVLPYDKWTWLGPRRHQSSRSHFALSWLERGAAQPLPPAEPSCPPPQGPLAPYLPLGVTSWVVFVATLSLWVCTHLDAAQTNNLEESSKGSPLYPQAHPSAVAPTGISLLSLFLL